MSNLVLRLAEDATVRGLTTRAGMQVFSAYDFINLVCPKSGNYSKQVWKRLISEDSIFKDEIEFTMEFSEYHYGIHRNTRIRQTPMMTLRALQRLVMILGGKVVADFRQIVEGTFTRFMAGDMSMIEEIRANTASDAPIHQTYLQALAQEPVVETVGVNRQLEREDALFEFELKERTARLKDSEISRMQTSAVS
jgi:hypothetical protein